MTAPAPLGSGSSGLFFPTGLRRRSLGRGLRAPRLPGPDRPFSLPSPPHQGPWGRAEALDLLPGVSPRVLNRACVRVAAEWPGEGRCGALRAEGGRGRRPDQFGEVVTCRKGGRGLAHVPHMCAPGPGARRAPHQAALHSPVRHQDRGRPGSGTWAGWAVTIHMGPSGRGVHARATHRSRRGPWGLLSARVSLTPSVAPTLPGSAPFW